MKSVAKSQLRAWAPPWVNFIKYYLYVNKFYLPFLSSIIFQTLSSKNFTHKTSPKQFFFVFLPFPELLLQHMEVPRPGQPTEWMEIFAKDIFDKALIFSIYKMLIIFKSKRQAICFINGQKT